MSDAAGGVDSNVSQPINEKIYNDFDIQQGEVDMLVMGASDIPQQPPATMLIASSKGQAEKDVYGSIGECLAIKGTIGGTLDSDVNSVNLGVRDGAARIFGYKDPSLPSGMPEKKADSDKFVGDEKYFGVADINNATIEILVSPKHGKIEHKTSAFQDVFYAADSNYVGTDKAIFMVTMGGYKIKMVYYIKVLGGSDKLSPDDMQKIQRQYCPTDDWKISADPTLLPVDLASVQRDSALATILADASQALKGFTDLPNNAVGETNGEGSNAAITLDDNAAGHGWFVDSTPLDNSEFLPTADPTIWMAKAGSEADGKMDMLSVLLHEFGHALGFEHSSDNNDFMAPVLAPGERRLPTSNELALMGLVQKRANGREQLVATNPARLQRASELLDQYEVIWRQRLAQLDHVLLEKGK